MAKYKILLKEHWKAPDWKTRGKEMPDLVDVELVTHNKLYPKEKCSAQVDQGRASTIRFYRGISSVAVYAMMFSLLYVSNQMANNAVAGVGSEKIQQEDVTIESRKVPGILTHEEYMSSLPYDAFVQKVEEQIRNKRLGILPKIAGEGERQGDDLNGENTRRLDENNSTGNETSLSPSDVEENNSNGNEIRLPLSDVKENNSNRNETPLPPSGVKENNLNGDEIPLPPSDMEEKNSNGNEIPPLTPVVEDKNSNGNEITPLAPAGSVNVNGMSAVPNQPLPGSLPQPEGTIYLASQTGFPLPQFPNMLLGNPTNIMLPQILLRQPLPTMNSENNLNLQSPPQNIMMNPSLAQAPLGSQFNLPGQQWFSPPAGQLPLIGTNGLLPQLPQAMPILPQATPFLPQAMSILHQTMHMPFLPQVPSLFPQSTR